jgi:hypothetical protein
MRGNKSASYSLLLPLLSNWVDPTTASTMPFPQEASPRLLLILAVWLMTVGCGHPWFLLRIGLPLSCLLAAASSRAEWLATMPPGHQCRTSLPGPVCRFGGHDPMDPKHVLHPSSSQSFPASSRSLLRAASRAKRCRVCDAARAR